MFSRRFRAATLALGATLGLAACSTYGDNGDGYRSAGYYRGGYALSDGGPFYGWYDNFYYPGSGYYLYDRGGRRHAMNHSQRQHWLNRARSPEDRQQIRQNYRQFRADRQGDRTQFQAERRANREALQTGQVTRDAFRAQRESNRQEFRQERRGDQRALRQGNRRAVRD
jgi:hypothetical protein